MAAEALRELISTAEGAVWLLAGDAPSTAKVARDLAVAELQDAPGGVLDAVRVVVSELVTNAMHHSHSGLPGGRIGLRVLAEGGAVTVTVADEGGDEVPTVLPEDRLDGGMGLAMCGVFGVLAVAGGDSGRLVSVRIPMGDAR